MSERALRDATEALPENIGVMSLGEFLPCDREALAKLVIERHLDSLRGELPEEAVEAALKSVEPDVHIYGGGWTPEEIIEGAVKAALRSLRSSLGAEK